MKSPDLVIFLQDLLFTADQPFINLTTPFFFITNDDRQLSSPPDDKL